MGREGGERRQHPRVPIAAKHITIYLPDVHGREQPHTARLVDLSPAAIGVSAQGAEVALGTRVSIELERSWWRFRRATVPGVVCRISEDGTRLAIQFAAESAAARKRLDAFVSREQRRFDSLIRKTDGAQLAESLRRIELEVGPPKHEGARVVLLTSARAVAGQGSVAAGLAVVLAHEGRRVLLVDIDDDTPAIENGQGSTPVERLSTPLSRNVDVLSLGSRHDLDALTAHLHSSAYHFAILNAPPLLSSVTARQLANVADDAFVVAETSISKERDLIEVRDLLARSTASFRGVILSDDSARPPRTSQRGRRLAKLVRPREDAGTAPLEWRAVASDRRPAGESKVTP